MVIPPLTNIQASQVKYALHSLGWKAFQDLCITIATEIWRCPVQSFFDSNDGGRDGAFIIRGNKTGQQLAATIQCKFTAKENTHIRVSTLTDEIEKAKNLASKGLAANYILFTNQLLTGKRDEELKSLFEKIPGIESFHAYGHEAITQIIRDSSRLRMLVPRVYGLGDLSEILDDRARKQAFEILSSLGDDLKKFVITSAHRESARALVEHNFVLLLGAPACGKSTIAATLSVGAIDEWKSQTYKISSAAEFIQHSNPNDQRQLFWVDDAFGATQLDRGATEEWNRAFPHVIAAISRGARFIFTSRDYIFKAAKNILKQSALPVMKESQVVIEVEDLSAQEREQVLYNHIRLGDQSKEFKADIKEHLGKVAAHPKFSPEIARRLGNSVFTSKITPDEDNLEKFTSNPLAFLLEVIETLSESNKAALSLVFMGGGRIASPVTISKDENEILGLLGSSGAEARRSLKELEGSLLLLTQADGYSCWQFKHPTVRDAFSQLVAGNSELLDIYLSGTPLDVMFNEITCGKIELKGSKVNIPRSRFRKLLSRISPFEKMDSKMSREYVSFLSYRCDKSFLEEVIAQDLTLLQNLEPDPSSFWGTNLGLMVTFQKYGLLPATLRSDAVAAIINHSICESDNTVIDKQYRPLFSPKKFPVIAFETLQGILAKIDGKISELADDYSQGDPEDVFLGLDCALTAYASFFQEHDFATNLIRKAQRKMNDAIQAIDQKDIGDLNLDSPYTEKEVGESKQQSRSIFDDVDE